MKNHCLALSAALFLIAAAGIHKAHAGVTGTCVGPGSCLAVATQGIFPDRASCLAGIAPAISLCGSNVQCSCIGDENNANQLDVLGYSFPGLLEFPTQSFLPGHYARNLDRLQRFKAARQKITLDRFRRLKKEGWAGIPDPYPDLRNRKKSDVANATAARTYAYLERFYKRSATQAPEILPPAQIPTNPRSPVPMGGPSNRQISSEEGEQPQ